MDHSLAEAQRRGEKNETRFPGSSPRLCASAREQESKAGHGCVLVQLPIPPVGMVPVVGNVPLAAGCLISHARRCRLADNWQFEILPSSIVDRLGDLGIVQAIVDRRPDVVAFSCYLWNVERSLWVAERLKERLPATKIVFGGPEITDDNEWLMSQTAVDRFMVGEGEAAFAECLGNPTGSHSIKIPSPYLDGILAAGPGETMFLETARGCRFRCRFCYYPKMHSAIRYMPAEAVRGHLRYARDRKVGEVFFVDPTLNQRPDFVDFVTLLAEENRDRRLKLSGELRAEGIDAATAKLLADAGFHEVEVGLQSVDPVAQKLMGRRVNLPAFCDGVRAMAAAGIRVKTDLILGLPGDSVDSVRRGIDLVAQLPDGCEAQVFNLSLLPGTAFRRDAKRLGLVWQSRPPYYVLATPTLSLEQMADLMAEAESALGTTFDPHPEPAVEIPDLGPGVVAGCRIDLDDGPISLPPAERRALAFLAIFRSADFESRVEQAAAIVEEFLRDNPHTTLEVQLEPALDNQKISARTITRLEEACYSRISYLDRFFSVHPGATAGAKRVVRR